jgi:hypothetical protein
MANVEGTLGGVAASVTLYRSEVIRMTMSDKIVIVLMVIDLLIAIYDLHTRSKR